MGDSSVSAVSRTSISSSRFGGFFSIGISSFSMSLTFGVEAKLYYFHSNEPWLIFFVRSLVSGRSFCSVIGPYKNRALSKDSDNVEVEFVGKWNGRFHTDSVVGNPGGRLVALSLRLLNFIYGTLALTICSFKDISSGVTILGTTLIRAAFNLAGSRGDVSCLWVINFKGLSSVGLSIDILGVSTLDSSFKKSWSIFSSR